MKRRRMLLALTALVGMATLMLGLLRVGAERFRPRIHAAIERSLGRTVELTGECRFSIWNGPGFSITNVVIHEDPAVGIEPFAYVAELSVSVPLRALLQGRIEVARLLLGEPTVNLVKQENGAWNIRPLLTARSSGPGRESRAVPEFRVRAGRLNLKFGDTKSVLYLANMDLELDPGAGSSVGIRFRAEPARTDRPAQGIGTLTGRGIYRWYPDSGEPSRLEMDVDLERSAISDLVSVLDGRGAGMRGFLATRAKLEGPLDALQIEGSLRLDDIQRWDLLRAASARWPIRYRGSLALSKGLLALETLPPAGAEAAEVPFRFRLRAQDLLENPAWGAILEVREMPVATLREFLSTMDVQLPGAGAIRGNLSGVLSYSPPAGIRGLLDLPEAWVTAGENELRLRGARIAVEGTTFRLGPARLEGDGQGMEIEGAYSPEGYSVTWRTGPAFLPVRDFAAAGPRLLPEPAPLFEALMNGQWRGTMTYRSASEAGRPGRWQGQVALRDASLRLEGLASVVTSLQGTFVLRDGVVAFERAEGEAGGIAFQASHRGSQWRLHAGSVDVAALEKLFEPTLRRGNSLLRTLTLRPVPAPEWLRARKLQAEVVVESLYLGDSWLGSLKGTLVWNGSRVVFEKAIWQREDALASGVANLRLDRAEPAYAIDAEVRALPWKGGVLEGQVKAEAAGSGLQLLRSARISGRFTGRSLGLALPPEREIAAVAGAYELSLARGTPSLKLTGLAVTAGTQTYDGQGFSEGGGRVVVDLTSAARKVRLSGTLWPFELEAVGAGR